MRAWIFLAVIMLVSICLFAFSGDTEEEMDAQPILIEHREGADLYAQPLSDGRVMYFYEIRDGDCVKYRIVSSTSIGGSFKPNF